MTGGITYDGIEGSEGGNIFKDVQFWVSHRIPMRPAYVDMIKNNGGTVVPLEKQADMLIADHMRKKNAPPGSYSWKFIQDSVDCGIAQIKDKYLIGPDPDEPRPAASGTLARGRRTPFTQADDDTVIGWVFAHRHLSNLKMFQELEKVNPRHTWQSWQDRWKKKLCDLPHQELERRAASAPSDGAPPPEPPAQEPPAKRTLPPQPPPPKGRPKPRSSPKQATKHVQQDSSVAEQDEVAQPSASGATTEAPEEHPPQDMSEEELGELEAQRAGFYQDYQEFAEENGIPVNFKPSFPGGQSCELFDLGHAVLNQQALPEEIEWDLVLEVLNLDGSRPDVMASVRQCYEEKLQEFLAQMASFDDESFSSSIVQDQEGDDEDTGSEVAQAEGPILAESSPHLMNSKRRFDEHETTSNVRPMKRKRLDQAAEIPSTPEHQLRVTQPNQDKQDRSPSLGERTPRARNVAGASDSHSPAPKTPVQKPPSLESEDSSMDVTPSQQLELEIEQSGSPVFIERSRRPEPPSPLEPVSRQANSPTQSRSKGPSRAKAAPQTKPAPRRSLPASFPAGYAPVPASVSPAPQRPRSLTKPLARPVFNDDRTDIDNSAPPRAPNSHISEPTTVEGWVEHYQSLGYSYDTVRKAMNATTMTPGRLLSHVLEGLSSGKGIPHNVEGIWSERDDKALRVVMSAGPELSRDPVDAEEYRELLRARNQRLKLEKKHGPSRVEQRVQFLLASDKNQDEDIS